MPEPSEILAGAAAIANQAVGVAVAWHLILFAALVALARGWRPTRRAARCAISALLASVAAFSLLFGNPFNGAIFTAGAVGFVALALALARGGGDGRRPVARAPSWQWWAGVAMLAYGWVYPHFLEAGPAAYLYAAPVGLLPCPTLAVAIGLALIGGLGTRGWGLALAALGLLYGLIGVLRLHVLLDLGLIAGALALAGVVLAPNKVRWMPRDYAS